MTPTKLTVSLSGITWANTCSLGATMPTGQRYSLYRLTYQSRSTLVGEQNLQITAIQDILRQSRYRNLRHGVSGILLYNQHSYFQVLEGSKAAVEQIFRNILRDKRHTDIVPLQRDPVDIRIFHSWSMAYKELPCGSAWPDYPIRDFPTKLLADRANTTPEMKAFTLPA